MGNGESENSLEERRDLTKECFRKVNVAAHKNWWKEEVGRKGTNYLSSFLKKKKENLKYS